MMKEEIDTPTIDIREDYLLKKDDLLNILLQDKTTGNNILWATDSYDSNGHLFAPTANITTDLITGTLGKLIQPRALKSKDRATLQNYEIRQRFSLL
jgi:hypothetical protein